MDAKEMLQPVQEAKQEKFARRLNEFREREWNRDNFQDNVNALKNTIETVDELITEVQADIEEIEGSANKKPKVDRIKEDYGDMQKLQEKNLSGYTPTLQEIADTYQELANLRRKVNAWKTYQFELARIGLEKLHNIATGYRSDYMGQSVQEAIQQIMDNVVATEVDAAEQRILRKVEQRMTDVMHGGSVIEKEVDLGAPDKTKKERIQEKLDEYDNPDSEDFEDIAEKVDTDSEYVRQVHRGE